MRVLLLTVEATDTICGKNTSLERIWMGLAEAGVSAAIVSTFERSEEDVFKEAHELQPDLIHAFNSSKAGAIAVRLADKLKVPLVLTTTGTDLSMDVYSSEKRENVLRSLASAAHIICANSEVAAQVAALGIDTPVTVATKGVHFPNTSVVTDRTAEGFHIDDVVYLLPGNFRQIKNQIFPIEPLSTLRAEGLPVHLVFIGHPIEEDYFSELLKACDGREWIHFPGERPRNEMYSWYRLSDIILNTSFAEGGSNVVLEAMAAERCVLASGVEGNRDFVRSGGAHATGILYDVSSEEEPMSRTHDPDNFTLHARALTTDRSLRDSFGANALAYVQQHHSIAAEANAHLAVYSAALSSADRNTNKR